MADELPTRDLRSTGPVRGPVPGEVFADRYRVEALLGEGGFGTVYAALDTTLARPVALKVLTHAADDADGLARFLQEARAAAALPPEHVAIVHEVSIAPPHPPFLVMERLVGRDLEAELRATGPLPVERAVELVLQAVLGVAHAHARGLVHRDLKPRNLFLAQREDGRANVKVLDFGIAKSGTGSLTRSRDVFGTTRYMAPEQLRSSAAVDHRADVWSLGIVLYELVTGATAFEADTEAALAVHVLTEPHVPLRTRDPELPAALEVVLDRCLEKRPDDRYASLAELAEALAPWSRDAEVLERIARVAPPAPGSARAEPTRPAARATTRPPRRDRLLVAGALLVGAGGLAFGLAMAVRAREPTNTLAAVADSTTPTEPTPDAASLAVAPGDPPGVPRATPHDAGPAVAVDASVVPRPSPRTVAPSAGALEIEHRQLALACRRLRNPPLFLAAGTSCDDLAALGCTRLLARCATVPITPDERSACRDLVASIEADICTPRAAAEREVTADPARRFAKELREAAAGCAAKLGRRIALAGTVAPGAERAACINIADAIADLCHRVEDPSGLAAISHVECRAAPPAATAPEVTLAVPHRLVISTHQHLAEPNEQLACLIADRLAIPYAQAACGAR